MGFNNKGYRLIGILALIIGLSTELVYDSTLNAKLSEVFLKPVASLQATGEHRLPSIGQQNTQETAPAQGQARPQNMQGARMRPQGQARPQNMQGARMRPPTLSEIDQRVQAMNSPDSIASTYLMFGRSMSRSAPQIIPEVIDRMYRLDGLSPLAKQSYIADLNAQMYQVSDVDSALYFFDVAEQAYEELAKYEEVVRVLISKARLLVRNNDYLSAEEVYFHVLELANQAELPAEVTQRYRSELLNLYVRVGAVELAMEEYETILAQRPSITQSERCSYILSLSNSYKRNFEYQKAQEILSECAVVEDLGPDHPRNQLNIAIYRSLSDLARLSEQPNERRKWAETALEVSKKSGRVDFNTYLTLVQVYREQGLQDSLAPLFHKMEAVPDRLVQLPARLLYIKEKSAYLNSQSREQEAIELVQTGLELAERTTVPGIGLVNDLRTVLAESYAQLGQNDLAFALMRSIRVDELEALKGAQIQEEQMAKVRFQMRSKNMEIEQISSQLSTTQRIAILGIIILIFTIAFIIYRAKKESQLRLEKTRNRISQDLHDDLSASLNSISVYAGALKSGESNGNTENFLQQITEISSDAADRVSDIIWAIQLKSISWEAFTSKVRRFALDLCESKNIELDVEVESNVDLSLSQEQNYDFWLAFKEAFTNALRHSDSSKLEMKLYTFGKNIYLELTDNGIGFVRSDVSHENGLINIEERMQRLKGTAEIHSEVGKGTKWILSFPMG